jgi:glycogen debranching enzyme
VVAREYYRTTQDYSFLRSIWSNILAAFRWITVSGDRDGDGYVEYLRMNPWGLFHQGWKDGVEDHLGIEPPVAMVEAQGYTYAAFQNLIFLEKALGENNVADKLAVRSEALKTRFNEDYWMRQESSFALALDGDKRQKAVVTSNPGHLLFTGIVASDKVKPLVSRLFQADLWTSYGIRTHSDREPDYDPYSYHKGSVWPHDNWIICKGLLNLGFTFQADRIKAALLKAFKELGGIPELYAVVDDRIIDLHEAERVYANPLQAWSTAALLEMIWTD